MSSTSPHEAGSEGAGPSRPADSGSPPSSSSSRGGSVEQPPLTPPQEGITVTGGDTRIAALDRSAHRRSAPHPDR